MPVPECLCRTRRGPGPRLYAIQVPPPIHSGPGPGPSRTWSSHFLDVVPFHPLDLVQPPCPTGTPEPHSLDLVHHTKLHLGQISATPRPKHSHTAAKHPLDLVHPLFGRGAILPPLDLVQPPCPTGTPEPHSLDLVHHTKLHLGQISATPRPKHSHTAAKHPLDRSSTHKSLTTI